MKHAFGVMLLCLSAGCARQQWPEPPAIEPAQYLKHYESWLFDQQDTARQSSIIVGIWPIEEGETPFGSDTSLPIVLPANVPSRAGVIRRSGEKVTVTPARGVALQGNDGKPVTASTDVLYAPMTLGSLQMLVMQMEDGRVFVSASDEAHPVTQGLSEGADVSGRPALARGRALRRVRAAEGDADR